MWFSSLLGEMEFSCPFWIERAVRNGKYLIKSLPCCIDWRGKTRRGNASQKERVISRPCRLKIQRCRSAIGVSLFYSEMCNAVCRGRRQHFDRNHHHAPSNKLYVFRVDNKIFQNSRRIRIWSRTRMYRTHLDHIIHQKHRKNKWSKSSSLLFDVVS